MTYFQGNMSNSFAVIAYTVTFKKEKMKESESIAFETIFVRVCRKLQRSDVGPLWRYCESMIRSYLHAFM